MTNVHLPDSVGKVAGEIYSDTASNTLKEASKIGVDALKTIRLALAPLQFIAALQDRLARHIDKAIRQVPEENRTTPIESVFLPTAEKLKFQEESNPLTTLYINLLSRSMDKERLGEAHPAFYTIINQLCPDEAAFVEHLAEKSYCILPLQNGQNTVDILKSEETMSEALIHSAKSINKHEQYYIEKLFNYELFTQPELFETFLEHLITLGLVIFLSNDDLESMCIPHFIPITMPLKVNDIYNSGKYSGIKLTKFGKLFHQACCKN